MLFLSSHACRLNYASLLECKPVIFVKYCSTAYPWGNKMSVILHTACAKVTWNFNGKKEGGGGERERERAECQLGRCLTHIIIIIINPLTARVFWAPQMISQPVSSIFPCSPLPSGTWWTLGLSIPWCCLSTSSSVCLVYFPLSLCLARWFWPDPMNGRHDHITAVCVGLQWSSTNTRQQNSTTEFSPDSPRLTDHFVETHFESWRASVRLMRHLPSPVTLCCWHSLHPSLSHPLLPSPPLPSPDTLYSDVAVWSPPLMRDLCPATCLEEPADGLLTVTCYVYRSFRFSALCLLKALNTYLLDWGKHNEPGVLGVNKSLASCFVLLPLCLLLSPPPPPSPPPPLQSDRAVTKVIRWQKWQKWHLLFQYLFLKWNLRVMSSNFFTRDRRE